MSDIVREEARLIILKELAAETNWSASDVRLVYVLDRFGGLSRSREWVREELRRLEELGAVTFRDAGTARIATLTAKGRDHVERRVVIEGVQRPSPEA